MRLLLLPLFLACTPQPCLTLSPRGKDKAGNFGVSTETLTTVGLQYLPKRGSPPAKIFLRFFSPSCGETAKAPAPGPCD
ncbi:hypothetical protein V8C43DRAFT_294032 [Trichoderma afarasin]